jgi:adenine-specific DNA-methyltransferase
LLPSEFLQTNYGKVLRDYLSSSVELLRLHTYDTGTSRFENTRVTSAVVVFRNKKALGTHCVKISKGGTIVRPEEIASVELSQLQNSSKWSFLSLTSLERTNESAIRLGQLFEVKRGIATGANDHFVLKDDDVERLRIPRDWVKPVIPKARFLFSNIVDADGEGNPKVEPRLWLIDTDKQMSVIRRSSTRFAKYLENVEAQVGSRALIRARRPFYQQEQRLPSMYFASGMIRKVNSQLRSRFFLNRSDAVVLNNYMALYPKAGLRRLLDEGIVSDVEVLDALAAISDQEIAREGREYVTGLQKIEPRELARVEFPSWVAMKLSDAVLLQDR